MLTLILYLSSLGSSSPDNLWCLSFLPSKCSCLLLLELLNSCRFVNGVGSWWFSLADILLRIGNLTPGAAFLAICKIKLIYIKVLESDRLDNSQL